MNKSFSLYLDLIRFSAALTVFFSHVSSQDLTDGILWQFKAYAGTAVMIFFVMSGYVIAYITDVKENTLSTYSIARIARLWSVVIPALLITAVCDYIGILVNPALYFDAAWTYPSGSQFFNYLLSFFLVQNVWNLNLNPGINAPFWSLTFEFIYYILFGIFYFIHHKIKWLLLLLVSLAAGPIIIIYLPIWIMGYYLYKLQKKHQPTYKLFYLALFAISPLLLIFFVGPEVREFSKQIDWLGRKTILGDYFDATLFTIHLFFIRYLVIYIKDILLKFEYYIRWAASLTFALYLFHRPIIQLIAAIHDGEQSNWVYRITMICVTLFIVSIIGRWCELKKTNIKNALHKLLSSNGAEDFNKR